jgi:four helix bundle protein
MSDFRDLIAWQKAHQLALQVYELTSAFPASEQFALSDQLRRATVSVSANIAEGRGRSGDRAFAHYLDVALGSLAESQALPLLARDLGYIAPAAADQLLPQSEELGKIISSLMARCRKQQP